MSMPRTGTTIIQQMLSAQFRVQNFSEPFDRFINRTDPKKDYPIDSDPYKWAAKQTSGTFKLLSHIIHYFDFEKIMSMAKFDHVVMIQRKNLADGLCSLKYASINNKFHRVRGENIVSQRFKVEQYDLQDWNRYYQMYNESKNFIINSNIPYDLLSYDDFAAGRPQYVAGRVLQQSSKILWKYDIIPNDLCYEDLCMNYQEVQTHIRNTTC